MYRRKYLFYSIVFILSSCSSFYQPTSLQYTQYRIQPDLKKDSAMVALISPYTKEFNVTMNKVIGTSANQFERNRPESELGNFLADVYRVMAEKNFNRKVDAGFMNVGGIRSYLSKGNITVGKIFEIMPFDNLLVLQELKGTVFQAYLDKMAEGGGWPVSKGVQMVIRNKKATEVMINGKPLDPNAVYVVAHSDYIANGGDDCTMLKPIPQINRGYLMRDAIIDYITELTGKGLTVNPVLENRVTNGR